MSEQIWIVEHVSYVFYYPWSDRQTSFSIWSCGHMVVQEVGGKEGVGEKEERGVSEDRKALKGDR